MVLDFTGKLSAISSTHSLTRILVRLIEYTKYVLAFFASDIGDDGYFLRKLILWRISSL